MQAGAAGALHRAQRLPVQPGVHCPMPARPPNLWPALIVLYGLMQKAAATHEGAQYHAPIVWKGQCGFGLTQNLLKC